MEINCLFSIIKNKSSSVEIRYFDSKSHISYDQWHMGENHEYLEAECCSKIMVQVRFEYWLTLTNFLMWINLYSAERKINNLMKDILIVS